MEKTIVTNKKARFEYFVEESLEVGIVLVGCEVKSIRQGHISLQDSYADIKNGEVFLYNSNILPYQMGSYNNVNPKRVRKLLLSKKEIKKLNNKLQQNGYTLIPLKVYLKGHLVKIELGLCKGKKNYDKRESIKANDNKRNIDRIKKEY